MGDANIMGRKVYGLQRTIDITGIGCSCQTPGAGASGYNARSLRTMSTSESAGPPSRWRKLHWATLMCSMHMCKSEAVTCIASHWGVTSQLELSYRNNALIMKMGTIGSVKSLWSSVVDWRWQLPWLTSACTLLYLCDGNSTAYGWKMSCWAR